ncbi:hypothetical protein F4778DRAFT_470764 [Xylariomycetidae sp. FL2044]|nr:hypothetical protein F4778DRAFT_470764 [Xylariomycetidae sp. FL2044]
MPLQKSFSEQSGSNKPRHRWNKSRSHSAVNHASSTTRNQPSRPLQPVSEVTKNKLNAFNFRPPEEKLENGNNSADSRSAGLLSESTASLSASKDSITTPVSRLAWQDLIGISEMKEDEEEDTSPNERIGWDTTEIPKYEMSPVLPRRRGKKRARSSSPLSSPAVSSKHTTPAVNVKQLSRALKSPNPDPAIELWDRFSLSGSMSAAALGAPNPALAQIMASSSPKPPRSHAGGSAEGGLRRAISCGANWPKRRRAERAEAALAREFLAEESPSRSSKSSMVNALLKTVTGEINKSKAVQTREDALRSPSPRKGRPSPVTTASGSPVRNLQVAKASPTLSTREVPNKVDNVQLESDAAGLSDYGDDDFDDDTLMELDASIMVSAEDSQALPRPPEIEQGRQQQMISKQDPEPDDDEFADDDIFTAAEDLMSRLDTTKSALHAVNPQPQSIDQPRTAPAAHSGDQAEDIYGDDFGGDFDFEAAEIAATQSVKQPSGTLSTVRR